MKKMLVCAVLFTATLGAGTALAQAPQDVNYRTIDGVQLEEKLQLVTSKNDSDKQKVKEMKSVVKDYEKEVKRAQAELKKQQEQLKALQQVEKTSRNEMKEIQKAIKLRKKLSQLSN